MKHTISDLFYQRKGFYYILQKQPWILAQIKYFLLVLEKKQTKQKSMQLTEKNMAGHRVRAQVVEFHSEVDSFLHLTSSILWTGRVRIIHYFLTVWNFVCLWFQELWDLQLGSVALQGSRGGACDERRACSPGYTPVLLGVPSLWWGLTCARALRCHGIL